MTVPRDLLARSRRALAADRAGRRAEHDRPEVGSLVVLGTPDLPVEWLLVEERGDGYRAVAVDSAPWAGTADLRLEQTTECPVGVVRPRVELQVPHGALANHRGGVRVHPRDLQRLARHRQTPSDTRPVAPSRELETDLEPAYQEWLGSLVAERDRLAAELADLDTAEVFETPMPRADRPRVEPWWRSWRVAAALLLTAALAWTAGRLTARKDLLHLQRALGVAQATARAAEGPQVNLPIAWLRARSTERGDADVMTLEPDVDWVLFVVEAPHGAGTYRLTLLDAEGARVTSVRGLRPSATGELSLALPAASFEAGLYRVLIRSEPAAAAGSDQLELWLRVQVPAP